MASNYPGAVDAFDTIASDKKTSDAVGGRTHRAMHNDLGDAIEAVQAELGTDPAGASATVKARFEAIEANDWVTSARIAANAVGSSELADNAVDTAAIQDSAVTSAKIADGTIVNADINASAAISSAKLVFGTATHTSGTGSPEGVITAAPGSTFLQTDATTDVKGWIRWVKASGTGSTGWRAGPEADTGWRSLTTGEARWTHGTITMRRIGNTVHVLLKNVGLSELGAIYKPADGWRAYPSSGEPQGAVFREAAVTGNPYWLMLDYYSIGNASDRALTGTFNASHRFAGAFTPYITADAWPAVLPGSAA